MSLPIDGMLETALYADDLGAAEAFYHGILGLEVITRAEGRHVFFKVGPGVLLIFNPQAAAIASKNTALPVPAHGAHGPGHACFKVSAANMDLTRAALEAAGIEIEADLRWPNGARSLYFRDFAGNSLECAEPAIWGLDDTQA